MNYPYLHFNQVELRKSVNKISSSRRCKSGNPYGPTLTQSGEINEFFNDGIDFYHDLL